MIVWGGSGGTSVANGGRYRSTTDTWLTTQSDGAPSARNRHTAVWTGTEMIIWGGIGAVYHATGGR